VDSQEKWNNRYREKDLPATPCSLLAAHQQVLPTQGRALDLACGLGGNAILLANAGLDCDAVDISDIAIAKLADYARQQQLKIQCQIADIESAGLGLAHNTYDIIVVSYFLYRPLFPEIIAALKPRGTIFYQTFVSTLDSLSGGPSKADFWLAKDELSSHFKQFTLNYYHEGIADYETGQVPTAKIIAHKMST
jgi:tellurite methyltransferase